LLAEAGARVVKVESRSRPDGARRGPPAFYDLLNAGKTGAVVDIDTPAGLLELRDWLERADIVIESSRPRVMRNWGLDPVRLTSEKADGAWVAISAYGRAGPWQQRVGFGDDAAAAAGMVCVGADGKPRFVADALADPVTGLHAAVAALAAWVGGGSYLFDVPLRETVAHLALRADVAWPASSGPINVAEPRARLQRGA
jgi:crotonobetainyl-CoA:carnitine CoA-transferase CaiB-like acyl-CoA transferase